MPHQGLLAIAVLKASAFLVLLVLYLLARQDVPARFFRIWLAGWSFYLAYGALEILHVAWGGEVARLAMLACDMVATVLFFVSALVYAGFWRRLVLLWPLVTLGALGIAFAESRGPAIALSQVHWPTALLESALFISAGWVLWRYARTRSSHGALLLAGVLWLGGLHGMDRPDWPKQAVFLLRVAFGDFLQVALGIAMVVLVLETARARSEELSDKLRRSSLITAASTQTFSEEEVLRGVLQHLVESLDASHGAVWLLQGGGPRAELVLRAAAGFDEAFLRDSARIPVHEEWVPKVLQQDTPYVVDGYADAKMQRRVERQGLGSVILFRLPGKTVPLGVLGLGSTAWRKFQSDELDFLSNVANLLGLTIQNVRLFEEASAAQRQWANTFDSIHEPILVHDREFRVVRANRSLSERLGVLPGALTGRRVGQVLRRGSNLWRECPYCEGVVGNGDGFDPNLGGYFLVSNSDFHGAAGNPQGIVHVLKDITERKNAEEKYRNLIANAQEGVFISTPEGRFVDFNDAFLRMLGYERREELMRVDIPSTLFVNPVDYDRLKKLLREHSSVTNFEFCVRCRDGGILTVLESAFATRNAQGAVVSYQGFVLDITERKRAEQEIRRRNRELMVLNSIGQTLNQSLELREMLDQALKQVVELFGMDTGAIYLLDESSGAVRRAAAFGYRSEYAAYFPPTALPKDLLQQVRASRATVLTGPSLPLPAVFRDIQQKERLQQSYVVILWSKERMMGGLVVASRVMREFSSAEINLLKSVGSQIATTIEKALLLEETQQAYEDLRRTQEQLLQSEKMAAVGQLISGVAHELNNPLTAILGYGNLLSSGELVSPRGAEYAKKLHKQAQRTQRIVNNLLSFARQQKPQRIPVHLNQVLEDTLALREYDLKVNNIKVHRELAADLPMTSADPHQLQQVFLNILNNAVDAILETSDRGEVCVRTAHEGGRLLIEFTDSGPGVRDPMRVFDPFYTTKAVGKGTGLGLSICYGIVTEHGGEISVRNLSSGGAVFTVALPVFPVTEAQDMPLAGPQDALPCGRILLVDDEEAVLELEQEILSGRCQSVKAVRSGREAQQYLDRESVDVAVIDLKMPGEVTGRDLYHWICRRQPDLATRVVFTMSAAGGEETRALLEESSCQVIQKPFEVEKFLRVVRKTLAQVNASALKR